MQPLRPDPSNPYHSQRAPGSSSAGNRTSEIAQNTLAVSSSSEPRASMKGKQNYQPLQPSAGAAAGSHPMPPMPGSFAEPRAPMRGKQTTQQPLQPPVDTIPVLHPAPQRTLHFVEPCTPPESPAPIRGQQIQQSLQPSSSAVAGFHHSTPAMPGNFAQPYNPPSEARAPMRGQQVQQPLQPSAGAAAVVYSQTMAPSRQMPSDARAPMKR